MAAALLALGPAARVLPRPVASWGMPVLCGAGLLLAVAALLTGGGTIAAGPFRWAADGLSAWMALPLLLLGAVGGPRGAVVLGAMLLALLAADAISFGLALAGVVAALRLRVAAILGWAAASALAVLLLALHGGMRFDAIRALPPDPALTAAVLALALGGLVALGWRSRAEMPLLLAFGLYVLLRLLLDLCGPATPGWLAAPVLAAGLAGAVVGGLRLAVAPSLEAGLHAAALANAGLVGSGIGVALAARGVDLPPLAALALAGSLLLMVVGAVALALLRLCTDVVQTAAGSTALAALGGLSRRMPVTGLAMLAAAASLAGLPPSAGFAGLFLVVQAMLAGPRIGGFGVQLGFAVALALAGVAVAAIAAGTLRMAGLALLGPPRSAPAAAARDPRGRVQAAMAGLAALGLLLGVWPGAALLLARPVLRQLAAAEPIDAPAYFPAILAVLLAAGAGAAAWAVRLSPAPATRLVPAWDGGLPAGAADGEAYIPGLLHLPARPRLRAPSLRHCLVGVAAVLLVLLIVLAAR